MISSLQLPSCLSQSTLGDVLGRLHREALSGVLQVVAASETHEIELQNGLVVRVSVAADSPRLGEALRQAASDDRHFVRALRLALARARDERPLGERLLAVGATSQVAVSQTLQELHHARLNALFALECGQLRFRLLHRPTASSLVLGPALFLHHRKRYRDRFPSRKVPLGAEVARAYAVLGLTPGADLMRVNAAFRRLVIERHPDKVANLGNEAMERATRRFRDCVQSHRVLVEFLSGR